MMHNTQKLGFVIAAEFLLVFALHRASDQSPVPWGDLADWLQVAPLEQSVPSLIRLCTPGLSYWLLLSTIAYSSALIADIPQAVRLFAPLTLPSIQRLSQKAVRVSLAASLLAPTLPMAASAMNNPPPEVVVTENGVILPPGVVVPSDPVVEEPPTYTPTPAAPTPEQDSAASSVRLSAYAIQYAGTASVATSNESTTYTVRRGDNLWTIAEAHLTVVTGTDVSDAVIAPYWGRLVADNQHTLTSQNPDLINPGEVIVLPAVETS